MQPVGGKKAVAICILTILKNYSDSAHPLTQNEIIKYLDRDYEISLGRNAVSRTISLLRELGYNIKQSRNNKGIYISERLFDDIQLSILTDTVWTSGFISESEKKELTDKIASLGSKHFINRHIDIENLDASFNSLSDEFFRNIELISDSISRKKKIRFRYRNYDILTEIGEKPYEEYQASALKIILHNGIYFLECLMKGSSKQYRFRLDMIADTVISDENAETLSNTGRIYKSNKKDEYCFLHEKQQFILKIRKSFIREFIDEILSDHEIKENDIRISVYDNSFYKAELFTFRNIFIRCLLSFETFPGEILEPASMAAAISELSDKTKNT